MPKEIIYSSGHGATEERLPQAELGWSRDVGLVQLGTTRRQDTHPDMRTIADVMRDDLAYVDKHRGEARWTGDSNYAAELDQMIAVHETGWFVTLDRDGCNRLIRSLRKARDAAFGADA